VRQSTIAGSWYPGDRDGLAQLVRKLLSDVRLPKLPGRPRAVIAPHAGIQFSGAAAAWAYKALEGRGISRVILLGPSYHSFFTGLAPSGVEAYVTPLGSVRVDCDAAARLRQHPLFQGPQRAELPEHSLEMQLPFLQVVLGEFTMVPLVVGDLAGSDYREAAGVLGQHVDEHSVVVVSSDFTHYGPRFGYVPFRDDVKQNLAELDGGAIDRILARDLEGYLQYLQDTGATICGARPIGILLEMLPPAAQGTLLNYYTSGDMLHDYSDSVSYAAVVFTC
jgi:MEMO1 family protein